MQGGHDNWLDRIVQLTWRFTTLPSPMIMCQLDKFDDKIHEPQHGHWDKSKLKAGDYKLVYLRPVLYRSYHGKQACKGWVAMEGVHKEEAETDGKAKGPWWLFGTCS